MRPDLRVEIALPVHPLGDGLDHEVALGEAREVAVVVRDVDVRGAIGGRERRRLELRETGERLVDDAVGIALLRREVEQDDGNARVDEMSGDLRAHHAGAEHGGLADGKGGAGGHQQFSAVAAGNARVAAERFISVDRGSENGRVAPAASRGNAESPRERQNSRPPANERIQTLAS